MNEINRIINHYHTIDWQRRKAALAMVVSVEGSSYRRTGARMLVVDDGSWVGGISGGCLEGDALNKAYHAIHAGQPKIVTYDTSRADSTEVGVGLGCQGVIEVLFLPIDPQNLFNPVEVLKQALSNRNPKAILTLIQGFSDWMPPDATSCIFDPENNLLPNSLSEEILSAISNQQSKIIKWKAENDVELSVFVEVFLPPIRLVLCGGHYDIYPLMQVAKMQGWTTLLISKLRTLQSEAMTLADSLMPQGEWPSGLDARTAVILMAHDYKTDLSNLEYFRKTPVGYIGILGPKSRAIRMLKELSIELNDDDSSDFRRLRFPVGLDIGAANPEEIALSIIAEIIAFYTGRNGQPLKEREGPIYQ